MKQTFVAMSGPKPLMNVSRLDATKCDIPVQESSPSCKWYSDGLLRLTSLLSVKQSLYRRQNMREVDSF
jgi:hypothetical protein